VTEQQLDRDLPRERPVDPVGQPHLGHAAQADVTDQPISSDPAAFGPCGARVASRGADPRSSSRKALLARCRRAASSPSCGNNRCRSVLSSASHAERCGSSKSALVELRQLCQSTTESRTWSGRRHGFEEYVAPQATQAASLRSTLPSRLPRSAAPWSRGDSSLASRAKRGIARLRAAGSPEQQARQDDGCLRRKGGLARPSLYRSGALRPAEEQPHRERRNRMKPGRVPRSGERCAQGRSRESASVG
jgi:hypothetical protein